MLTKNDLEQINKLLEPIKETQEEHSKDVHSIKKNVRYMKKTLDVLIDVTNREDINLRKRVDRLEEISGLSNN